jgi:serine/threonine protein kinase
VNLEDFEMLGMMGQGAYGKVFLALKKKGGKYYAVKAICKKKIMQDKKQHEVFRERQALITLDHPNIVKMYWSFNVSLQFAANIC